MATLNVKDFPDTLYQKLKRQSRREGRSVASEVQVLLAEALIRSRKYTVNDFRGVGAEIWRGVDVQKYLDGERERW